MKLTAVMQRYVLHWGEMGTRWGVNRSQAQIHALLFLSPEPLSADEISDTLGVARSNVSVGLRELMTWKLVQVTQVLGDRRDFFKAEQDTWEMIRIIVEGRKRRELDPTIAALRECQVLLAHDSETPKAVRERIVSQLEFLESLTGWYERVSTLPRATLLKMMRLGAKIAKVIG
ncbi:MAG TPA: MarR family transcriptional regulator [Steroidobacteraceae bacterium]|nr:MarR family transcriptional regulator [Steroidobacteraceae bacterium]